MQRLEALLPQRAVAGQPVVELGQRLRPQAVHPALCVLSNLDQSGLTQHPQMPGDAGPGNRQQRGELVRRRLALPQRLEHSAPARISQRVQYRVHEINVTDRVRNEQGT